MRYLVTGGCGFIGSNLAAEVLKQGEELFVLDNLFRFGSAANLAWLHTIFVFITIEQPKLIRNIRV